MENESRRRAADFMLGADEQGREEARLFAEAPRVWRG